MVKIQTLALLSLASTALAAPAWWEQWTLDKVKDIQDKVLSHINTPFHHNDNSNSGEGLRLVQTTEDKAAVWMTEDQRLELLRKNIGYMDITDHQDSEHSLRTMIKLPLPKKAVQQKKFTRYVNSLSTANMEVALTEFTSFNNRYYRSKTGHQSAQWLYKQISDLIEESDADSDVSIRKFKHNWDQFSIIVRFEGTDDTLSNQPAIVGAHQDSVNGWNPLWGRSPGADDDGSGTVTTLEVFRSLIGTGFRPTRPVEFHWYSAEEAGLLGSQDVAESYEKKGVEVIAMIQNDMTGYVGTRFAESFGIVTDYVDPELTELVKVYAREYGDISVRETKCGYGCSDHASWNKYGYRSAFAIEGDFSDISPWIHGSDDDVTHVDFDHMKQFAKLTLGFAVELGHFSGKEQESRGCIGVVFQMNIVDDDFTLKAWNSDREAMSLENVARSTRSNRIPEDEARAALAQVTVGLIGLHKQDVHGKIESSKLLVQGNGAVHINKSGWHRCPREATLSRKNYASDCHGISGSMLMYSRMVVQGN
ncbi:Leucine aminopeptidase 1 [Mortierella sp. AD031]|nr:Leucine aminopeptidase 1 [Mortierella sp. AD031]